MSEIAVSRILVISRSFQFQQNRRGNKTAREPTSKFNIVRKLASLLPILEAQGSNLNSVTGYTEYYHSSLQENARIIPQITSFLILSNSLFTKHHISRCFII
jgi:hypothetical protein